MSTLQSFRREWVLITVLAALTGCMALLSPHFFTVSNLFGLTRHSIEFGIIACTMTLIIMTGGIDLSVGSLVGLCGVAFGIAWQFGGIAAGVGMAVVVGAAGGALNGTLVTGLRLPPLVVTLATMSLFRGLAIGWSGGEPVSQLPEVFCWIGQGHFGPVPVQLIVWLLIVAATWFVCSMTRLGRYTVAIGDNERAARFAKLPVRRVQLFLYTASGVFCALASLIHTARLSTARADAGQWFELSAIIGVVLGGTSITGGRGSVIGTFLGILIVGVLNNGLDLVNVPEVWQLVFLGSILIATAISNQLIAGRAFKSLFQ